MSRKVTNGLDLQNRPIDNVADPNTAQQAATKSYVDALVRGLSWKDEVAAASTGNVNLAAPGTSMDGTTLVVNNRVLLKDQTNATENGIYVWTASGATLTRAVDADSGTELSGATVTVQRGTVNADRVYHCNADDPLTLGTDVIPWVQIGGASASYVAGNGLTLTGQTFDVVGGTGIVVAADLVSIDTAVVVRKYAVNIGNGALTSITVNHALGTRDVQVTVFDNTTFEEVIADVVHTDTANVTIAFATAPANSAYRVVVQG